MLVESVTVVASWLDHATYGVNALRSSVPRYGSDVAPPTVRVIQMFRDEEAALGKAPIGDLPALEVGLQGEMMAAMGPAVRPFPEDSTIDVTIRYIADRTTDTALAMRHSAYTMRIVRRSLPLLMLTVDGNTARVVNNSQVLGVSNIRTVALYGSDNDTVTTGGVIVTLQMRDLWASSPAP